MPSSKSTTSAAFAALRKARLLKDDTILRCNIGPFNVSAIRSTHLQHKAQTKWDWNNLETKRWSACSNANLLIASFLSGEERIRARMTMGNQYTGVTEAIAVGEVRGSLEEALPNLKENVQLTVERILYGANQPFASTVTLPIRSQMNEIENTQLVYQEYLNKSDQGQCSRILLIDRKEVKDGNTEEEKSKCWSGGIIVQSMGHYGMKSIASDGDSHEKEKEVIAAFSEWWDYEQEKDHTSTSFFGSNFMEMSSEVGVASALQNMLSSSPLGLYEMNDVRVRSCDFHCRCTKEQFLSKINLLPVGDIVSIMNDIDAGSTNSLDLTCHHCNKNYSMYYEDLEGMLK